MLYSVTATGGDTVSAVREAPASAGRIPGGKMRKYLLALVFAVSMVVAAPVSAWALVTPTTGQPGAPANTCGPSKPVTPGNAANSPRSPFTPTVQPGNVHA